MSRLTARQKAPIAITLVIDQATALSLAVNASLNPSQYAAGLLIRLCKTAAAIGCKPHDLPAAAIVHSITRGN